MGPTEKENTPMHQHTNFEGATHVARAGGEVFYFTPDSYDEVCGGLFARNGVAPKVEPVNLTLPLEIKPVVQAGGHDSIGELRSAVLAVRAEENGFAPKQPIFRRGTRVNETGVENANMSRLEHEKKPLVADYCKGFEAQIASEDRRDLIVPMAEVRMASGGCLVVPRGLVDFPIEEASQMKRPGIAGAAAQEYVKLCTSERAIDGIVNRLNMPSASKYLKECWPELRAKNVNAWALRAKEEQRVNLRTRKCGDGREVYAVVSDSYTAFDADRIARAIRAAAPADARGSMTYDGNRARFEVMFHSDVQPKDYVAGEFFKAGAIIETDDTGGGSCKVSACVWQNLCLNIIDQARQDIANLRHIGDVARLAADFQEGFKAALSKIEPFREAWGYCVHKDVVTKNPYIPEEDLTLKAESDAILAGLFNGVIERELVPVRGQRKEVVRKLVEMYRKDNSAAVKTVPVSQAAVVNAFTRYAHEVEPARGPWGEDEIQRAAGQLVYRRTHLPFESIELGGAR